MAHLDKLKFSNRVIAAARPRRTIDSLEYRRNKLIANLEEQVELANRALQDKPLTLRRKRGHRLIDVRPRLWWKIDQNGNVGTEIRYNKVALNLVGRGTTIEVGPLRKLPSVYRTLIKAVRAGELDQAILNAARKSRPN